MLDMIVERYWERAYVVFTVMREAKIDIRLSVVRNTYLIFNE